MIKVVMFDWGDTVMENMAGFPGPMLTWKEVQATPGISEVLSSLNGKYSVVMATNAGESNETAVRKALQRVDLDHYFNFIFTARDLDTTKNDPVFYQTILHTLSIQPHEVLMTGDDLQADATIPASLGIRTIWFRRRSEPIHHLPIIDEEIIHLNQWRSALERINSRMIPSHHQVQGIFDEYPQSEGLKKHTRKVAVVAYLISQVLVDHGINISPVLALRAGLLHDVDKRVWRESGLQHGEKGAKILEESNFHVVAEIIRRHQVFTVLDPQRVPSTWEQKIVYLADKFVEKDRFVGMPARFDHFRERYPDSRDLMNQAQPLALQLENEVLQVLNLSQHGLYSWLNNSTDRVDLS
jgi:putative hydrolase of the HAD superfamily